MDPCITCLKGEKKALSWREVCTKMEQSILSACESVVARPEAALMQVPVEVMKLCSKSAQFM